MDIDLRIERLVLDGWAITPAERRALGAALETELSRLLSESGLSGSFTQGAALPAVRADDILITQPFNPAQVGAQIAQTVHAGLMASPAEDKR
jgi:hypothetical protein